jgi:riboflavin kinase/FMN adenylyltransferase
VQIYRDLPNLKVRTAVACGIFDGIHIGHCELIKRAVASSKEKGLSPLVLTFYPHPKMGSFILQEDERMRLVEGLGIEIVVVLEFEKIKGLLPEQYVREILIKSLNLSEIWIGRDHRFGKEKAGDLALLIELKKRYGFEVFSIPDVMIDGERVSSSNIKNLLLAGDIKRAVRFLGRPYSVVLDVVAGSRRGRRIGFCTANMVWPDGLFLPKRGVYLVSVKVDNSCFYGMANLGVRPTFGEKKTMLEVHIFDFSGTLYRKRLAVTFCEWIRDEIRFENEDKLREQLERDKENLLQKTEVSVDLSFCKD